MLDIAKGLKDINDAATRNVVAIELQEKIFAARDAQSAALERIRELEKEVADLKAWDRDKQRYELADVGDGTFAYLLKEAMRGSEPPHYICANCYEKNKKSVLHHMRTGSMGDLLTCNSCGAKNLISRGYKAPAATVTKTKAIGEVCPKHFPLILIHNLRVARN
jgi:hypothetical protein